MIASGRRSFARLRSDLGGARRTAELSSVSTSGAFVFPLGPTRLVGVEGTELSSLSRLSSRALAFSSGLGVAPFASSPAMSTSTSGSSALSEVKVISECSARVDLLPGTEGGWAIVMTEETDDGRPACVSRSVSAQPPLSAASKNADAKYRTSLCALERRSVGECSRRNIRSSVTRAHQKVVDSTVIFTVPGNLLVRVKVSSISMGSSMSPSVLSPEPISSDSHSSRYHGGDPADRKIPAAAAWVSVGELNEAEGLRLCGPLELRAISI